MYIHLYTHTHMYVYMIALTLLCYSDICRAGTDGWMDGWTPRPPFGAGPPGTGWRQCCDPRPRGRGFAGSDGRRPALCMQGGRQGAAGEQGGASPNLINALIVFGALEDKNGISQSLRHGTKIKPRVTFKSNREPRSLIIPHRKGKVQSLKEASEIDRL